MEPTASEEGKDWMKVIMGTNGRFNSVENHNRGEPPHLHRNHTTSHYSTAGHTSFHPNHSTFQHLHSTSHQTTPNNNDSRKEEEEERRYSQKRRVSDAAIEVSMLYVSYSTTCNSSFCVSFVSQEALCPQLYLVSCISGVLPRLFLVTVFDRCISVVSLGTLSTCCFSVVSRCFSMQTGYSAWSLRGLYLMKILILGKRLSTTLLRVSSDLKRQHTCTSLALGPVSQYSRIPCRRLQMS